MKRAYVDSCIWITLVEGLEAYRPPLRIAIKELAADGWRLCTADAVRLEVLVQPQRAGRAEAVRAYEGLLAACDTLPTHGAVFSDARLVAVDEGLKAMDAVHLSIARAHGCKRFLTTDPHFRHLRCIEPRWIDLGGN
jgi:predicted nucleic acid-binding protein